MMSQQSIVEVNVIDPDLPSAFLDKLEALAGAKEAFVRDFPESALLHRLEPLRTEVEAIMQALEHTVTDVLVLSTAFSLEQKDAWMWSIIAKLDEYLKTRVEGKYYLPAWCAVHRLRFNCWKNLSRNQERVFFSTGLEERCHEIASAAQHGFEVIQRELPVSGQGPLLGCIQQYITEELEEGVRNAPARHADREEQIVVLLKVLVGAAERKYMSLSDMQSLRFFLKRQTEKRPDYEGVFLSDSDTYRQAIERQNALLKTALQFFPYG